MSRSGFRRGDRDRAKAKFRALPKEIREEVTKALEQNAEELANEIRDVVPFDDGDLMESVRWNWGTAERTFKGRTIPGGADTDLSVTVSEGDGHAFYAKFLEYGHANLPAQPHFFPTYRRFRRRLKSRLTRAVTRVIKRNAATGGD